MNKINENLKDFLSILDYLLTLIYNVYCGKYENKHLFLSCLIMSVTLQGALVGLSHVFYLPGEDKYFFLKVRLAESSLTVAVAVSLKRQSFHFLQNQSQHFLCRQLTLTSLRPIDGVIPKCQWKTYRVINRLQI